MCAACQTAVHKKCHEKLLSKCSGSVFNSASTTVSEVLKYQIFVLTSQCCFSNIAAAARTLQDRHATSLQAVHVHVTYILRSLRFPDGWFLHTGSQMRR